MTATNTSKRPIALVTGAARRIGRAIALKLAADGWDLLIHHNRSAHEAEELAECIARDGARAIPIQCELTNTDQVGQLLDKCNAALGPPTCLVNNASAFLIDELATLTTDIWDTHMNANLRAPVFLSSHFARQLPKGKSGNIINILDQRVMRPTPEYFSYTISKVALWTATKTMAQALAPNIRVNAVGPGPVLQSVYQTEADFAAEVADTLLKYPCPPEEIAEAVSFILRTNAMTGQLITLDSGEHLS